MVKHSEKPFFRYPRFWYYVIITFAITWNLRGSYPDKTLVDIFGAATDYIVYLANGLGGVAVIVPVVFTIIGFIKRKKEKKLPIGKK